jgi:DNA invertase Pin-like site-specific DNA recombinase
MKTAIYVRCSSKSQDTKSQEPDLQAWGDSQPEGTEIEWFSDTFTGTTMNRPGWAKLWAGVVSGKIDRIVIWRLDRLGRTSFGLIKLRNELVDRKIRIHSLRDSLDLETLSGRLTWNIIVSVAEYETEVRKERQLAGIDAVRQENGGKCPWGGRKQGARIKVSTEKEAAIHDMLSSKKPISEIARVLELSRPTIYRVLKAAN